MFQKSETSPFFLSRWWSQNQSQTRLIYRAGTIEVATGQKLVSTGSYACVRHPMYSGALVMLFATPLALGSWSGLMMFIPMTLMIVWRLLDEEKFLLRNLQGYTEYCEKVRSRLLPFVC